MKTITLQPQPHNSTETSLLCNIFKSFLVFFGCMGADVLVLLRSRGLEAVLPSALLHCNLQIREREGWTIRKSTEQRISQSPSMEFSFVDKGAKIGFFITGP
jgi:hypothetical protein